MQSESDDWIHMVFINRPYVVWYLADVWQEITELMGLVLQLLKIFFTQLLPSLAKLYIIHVLYTIYM